MPPTRSPSAFLKRIVPAPCETRDLLGQGRYHRSLGLLGIVSDQLKDNRIREGFCTRLVRQLAQDFAPAHISDGFGQMLVLQQVLHGQ
ncbi:MAG TPA: hypothetical protein VKT82_30890 [Ktedonobacterales bacterium]|nr:hypothetical protein [Ktedonobacterales bacterium]